MLPHEKELVQRLKDQPFALIGINSDEPLGPDGKRPERSAIVARNERFISARRADSKGPVAVGDEERAFLESARAALAPRLSEGGISWRNAVDGSTSGPWASRWNTHFWPHIFLIDAEGKVRHVDPNEDDLEAAIRALIAEAQAKK